MRLGQRSESALLAVRARHYVVSLATIALLACGQREKLPEAERSAAPTTPAPVARAELVPAPATEQRGAAPATAHPVDALPGRKPGTPDPAAPSGKPTGDPNGQAPPPAAATPAPKLVTVQRQRQMMGTIIQMTSVGVPDERAGPVLEAALDEMKRLEGLLSEWKPDSDVSKVNDNAGVAPVHVGPELRDNIRVGLQVARWSDGAFDLSWAALRGLYLFQPGQERVPTDAELKEKLPFVNYRDILLDDKLETVFLKRKGMQLGLGGIAKGYALEKAANILRDRGLENYMIFGGGQVLVNGHKGDRAWRVGVQHPRLNDYFGFVEASSGSIATSGDYEHAFTRDGKRWHHIIDLKTGRPVQHTASVTVVSESAFYADAIDTALFIMGAKKALKKLATAPGPKAEVLIVDSDMRIHMSPGMHDKLILRATLTDGKLPMTEEH
ncbi:MAG TPA: FAD:protein FMN transferase [Polyangiales bacterium]|nr:FAD:protein FMN transferase [Polyangiales bacterium]